MLRLGTLRGLARGSIRRPARRRSRGPTSVVRYLASIVVATLLVGGYVAFKYMTSPNRVLERARDYLTDWTQGQVQIDEADFAFFEGLHLRNVRIATPLAAHAAQSNRSIESRTVFFAKDLYLKHQPLSLLSGRLAISEIVATEPTFSIVKSCRDGRFNWQELFAREAHAPQSRTHPRIRLREARVLLSRLGEDLPAKPLSLNVLATPETPRKDVYTVHWTQRSREGRSGRLLIDLVTLRVQAVEGGLPTMPIGAALVALPPRLAPVEQWLSLLGLSGQISADDFVLDPKHQTYVTMTLRGVSLSLPLDATERTLSPQERFLRLDRVGGTIRFDGLALSADLNGDFNGSKCRITGQSTGKLSDASSISDIGFKVIVTCKALRLPEYDPAARPPEARFIDRWHKVKKFFTAFDPHGLVNLELSLLKAPGPKYGVVIQRGRLVPRGGNASYHLFPYRLEDLTGLVEFTDGGVLLKGLTGRHGTGQVVINGKIDQIWRHSAVELDIEAADAPFNEALYRALPKRYQGIWRQFDPRGTANVRVHLKRDRGTAERAAPWKPDVRAHLLGVNVCFVGFPYPIEQVTGRMRVSADRIELDQLSGRNGPASVTISGWACPGTERNTAIDLTVEASDVPLDEHLAQALPEDARAAFDQFRPAGRLSLCGRVFMTPGSSRVGYDMLARLNDASICYREFPYKVHNVNGTVKFTPEQATIVDVSGRHGQATIKASGSVRLHDNQPQAEVLVAADEVVLDDEFRNVLPDKFKAAWSLFDPAGTVSVRTQIFQIGRGDHAARSHRTVIRALGNDMTYKNFPLPLHNVRGRIIVTDHDLQLVDVTAEYELARLAFGGQFNFQPPNRVGSFRLEARNMPFSDKLYNALPWRMKRVWRAAQPQGTFDLRLDQLIYRRAGQDPADWQFDGDLTLHDAQLKTGFEWTGLEGTVSGRGQARGRGEGFGIDAQLDIKRATIDDRKITNVSGRLVKAPASSLLSVDDLTGIIYGGLASGFSQVTFGDRGAKYAVSVVVNDMQLDPFVNAKRKGDGNQPGLEGRVSGNMFLAGTAGDPSSRRGGGEVHIHQAEMAKLPLILSVLNVADLSVEDENAFHDTAIKFYLEADRLTLENIALLGPGLMILGSGWVHTPTQQMDLTLVAGQPQGIPPVPFFTEILEGAARELMEVTVTGTPGRPRFRVRSLRSVQAALETLLQPHARQR